MYVGKRVMTMDIPGRRRRGRPNLDGKTLTKDFNEKNLHEHQVGDRKEWKRLSRNSDPI